MCHFPILVLSDISSKTLLSINCKPGTCLLPSVFNTRTISMIFHLFFACRHLQRYQNVHITWISNSPPWNHNEVDQINWYWSISSTLQAHEQWHSGGYWTLTVSTAGSVQFFWQKYNAKYRVPKTRIKTDNSLSQKHHDIQRSFGSLCERKSVS